MAHYAPPGRLTLNATVGAYSGSAYSNRLTESYDMPGLTEARDTWHVSWPGLVRVPYTGQCIALQ